MYYICNYFLLSVHVSCELAHKFSELYYCSLSNTESWDGTKLSSQAK